jgi:hypothetical protein
MDDADALLVAIVLRPGDFRGQPVERFSSQSHSL